MQLAVNQSESKWMTQIPIDPIDWNWPNWKETISMNWINFTDKKQLTQLNQLMQHDNGKQIDWLPETRPACPRAPPRPIDPSASHEDGAF